MTPKYFYISTPIYYPNSVLHLGHAYTTVLSDVLARYKKMQGYNVFFSTGSDEHGQKIERAAKVLDIEPQKFVDQMALKFQELWVALKIDYSIFNRTSNLAHNHVVQQIFAILLDQGDIYLDNYQGWYCISDEEFVIENQMTPDKRHLTCGNELKLIKEESYFFRVSKYQEQLKEYYRQHPEFIYPESRMTEMLNNFLEPGLQDLSVSRINFKWGVPVLSDSKHIIYVWIDALVNYLSGLGYLTEDESLFKKYWNDSSEIVQVLGKEITRFHAIYWPILLMSLKLRLPNKLISHSWITMANEKMSKSKTNNIDPLKLIKEYGSDALRFFLIYDLHITRDSNYSEQLLIESYNHNLVNNLGNLLSRTMTMITKYYNNIIPRYTKNDNVLDNKLEAVINITIKSFQVLMDQYLINEAYKEVINLLHDANKYIEERTPWVLFANQDPSLDKVINNLCQILKVAAFLLKPVLIDNSHNIFKQLNIKGEHLNFNNLSDFKDLNDILINEKFILFARK